MGEVAVARVAPSGGEDEVDHGGRRGVGRAGRDISTWRWNSESDSGSGSDAGGGSDSGSVIQQAVHRPPRIREYQSLLPNSQTPPALPPFIYLFHYFHGTSHFGHLSRPHLAHAPPPPHCARGARCNAPLSSPAMPSSLLVPILVGGMLFTVRSVHICAVTLY